MQIRSENKEPMKTRRHTFKGQKYSPRQRGKHQKNIYTLQTSTKHIKASPKHIKTSPNEVGPPPEEVVLLHAALFALRAQRRDALSGLIPVRERHGTPQGP